MYQYPINVDRNTLDRLEREYSTEYRICQVEEELGWGNYSISQGGYYRCRSRKYQWQELVRRVWL